MGSVQLTILAMAQSLGHLAESVVLSRRDRWTFRRSDGKLSPNLFSHLGLEAYLEPTCHFIRRTIDPVAALAGLWPRLTESRTRIGVRSRASRASVETLEVRQLLSADFHLLKDITTLPDSQGSNPSDFTQVSFELYFTATTATHGTELWKTDGTDSGTKLVEDVFPGSNSSNAAQLTNVDGTLYFTADDGIHGKELWKSDGTGAGTMLVRDIKSGSGTSNPSGLTSLNGKLYFFAWSDNSVTQKPMFSLWQSDGTTAGTVIVKSSLSSGYYVRTDEMAVVNGLLCFGVTTDNVTLWKSDGTTAGTSILKQDARGSNSPGLQIKTIGGQAFFNGQGSSTGVELWKTDGTVAGTSIVKDIAPGTGGSGLDQFTEVNGTLYFAANDGNTGVELWRSDGTSGGTVRVSDIYTGPNGSYPRFLTNVNGAIAFVASNDAHGRELWKSDGTSSGTVIVKDIVAGSNSGDPHYLTNVNGTLFFGAYTEESGDELWKSDGTAAGTSLVKEINHTGVGSVPRHLTNLNGALLFGATSAETGFEVWRSDGTQSGTLLVRDIRGGNGGSNIRYPTNVNGKLFFSVVENAYSGGLWKSDGTSSGTTRLFSPDGNLPLKSLTNVNGILYFSAYDTTNGYELWRSDGTTTGTFLVKDIASGSFSSGPSNLTNVNGVLYFTAGDPSHGTELWKSDGTAAGTELVKDIVPGTTSSRISRITPVGDQLFFRAFNPLVGFELWKSDGTNVGTMVVKDSPSADRPLDPHELTNVDGTLFFSAYNSARGFEIWKSDGTEAGTSVIDVSPGVFSSEPRYLTNVNGTLYFSARQNTYSEILGFELWNTDGTLSGTRLVKDIFPGSSGAYPRYLTNVNGTLYFAADDGINGREIWKSDGTTAGTVLIRDISSGESSAFPTIITNTAVTVIDGLFYFSADDGIHGRELWQSDGTESGTILAKDFTTDSGSSDPSKITQSGLLLFTTALTEDIGRELFVSEINAPPTGISLSSHSVEENRPAGIAIGNFSTIDPNILDVHSYQLVTGLGDNDNASFKIVDNSLITAGIFNFELKSTYTIRVRSTDRKGLPVEQSFVISVTDVNETPSLALANTVLTLLEGTSAQNGTRVANILLSDDALGDNKLSLSGFDATHFEIVNAELRIRSGVLLDFESKAFFTVTVQADDESIAGAPDDFVSFSLTLTDVNESPITSLMNVINTLPENTATGSAIRLADIIITDDAIGNNVPSLSGPDATEFVITGNQLFLKAGSALDFETKSIYSVTVQVDDSTVGASPDATVTYSLAVTDVNEAPTPVSLANTVTSLPENTAIGTAMRVADISVTDDAIGTEELTLSGPDASAFVITGNQLFLKAGSTLNFEMKSQYSVTVQVDDSAVGVSPDATVAFVLTVTDVNEAPTAVSLTNAVTTLPESTTTGTVIRLADIAVTDDALGTNVLSLTGPDAAAFVITGNQLFLNVGTTLNFEAKSQFAVTVQVNDSSVGVSPDATVAFVLTISDVNEAPTAVALASTVSTLPENSSTNSAIRVADLLVTDDALGTNVLSLTGSDAAAFVITGNQLFLKAGSALNFETKSQYSVTVLVDDSTVGASLDATVAYSLTVTDLNEAPTLSLTSIVTSLNDNVSTNAAIRVADIAVADDATGTNEFLLTGTESNLFEIVDSELYLKAGSILNGAVKPELRLQVSVIDNALGSDPATGGSASIQIHVAAITPEIIAPTPLIQLLRPTFAWTSISSAASYDVWFENLSTGNSQYRQENITNSVYTANSDFGIGRYRVRIRSLDASQTPSRWSAPYEFRVTATVTWRPMEAVQRSSYPRLTWNPLPGADQYDLWINSVSPAKNPFVRIANLNQSAWTSSTAFPMGQYQAWVRGFAADGTSVTWSQRFDFSVSPTPVLTTAANVAFSGLPTITWNAIAGAVRFDVWVDNASTGTSQFDRASVVGTTYTPSKTFGIGKYRFWVRSIDAAGTTSAWSSRLEFSVNTPATIQPLNRIQVTARPTVTWTALPGAARYDLWIDERSTPTSEAVRITNLTTSSWTNATDLPMGLYRAWVRGIATDGTGATWSQLVEFYVAPAPVLTAGINATFDRTPTFAWNPVTGAVSYDLTVRNLNTGATVIIKAGITTTSWTMPTDLPNGLYRWWVLAVNAKGLRSQSANVADIQIGGQPNVLAPLTATDRRPMFSWSAIEGAASFMLHVNRIDVPQAAVIQLSGLTGVSYQSTVALPIGTYRVWMRAVSTTGTLSPWSLPVDFAVT